LPKTAATVRIKINVISDTETWSRVRRRWIASMLASSCAKFSGDWERFSSFMARPSMRGCVVPM